MRVWIFTFLISIIAINGSCQCLLRSEVLALELASFLQSMPKTNLDPKVNNFQLQKLWQTKANKDGVVFIETLSQGSISNWPKDKLKDGLSWNAIRAGDGLNCGFYALKNVLFLMNAFKQENLAFFEYLKSPEAFFDCMRIWGPLIYEHRQLKAPINNLIGGEIDILLAKLNNLKNILRFSSIDTDLEIVVIENQDLEGITGLVNEAIYQFVKKLALKQSGMFGVVQNTGGHWISFVVCKKENIQKIFYMDSCNVCERKDCREAVAVFTKSVTEIDKIIFNNQKTQMEETLLRMYGNTRKLAENTPLVAADKIDTFFTHILVSWQDNNQVAFDKKIQEQIFVVLEHVLIYLNQHRDVYELINWTQFGGAGNVRNFGGFKDVIEAVLDRMPDIDTLDLQKNYIEPLLKF